MSNEYTGQRFLVIETQNFAPNEGSWPMTSYLRLGGVPNPERVKDAATMRALTPAAGAITAATGAGEDLASRVMSFTDDERDRCDPPTLDDNQEATREVAAENALWAQTQKLQEARDELGAIEGVLLSVWDDPEGWLGSLYQQAVAAAKRARELEEAYELALGRLQNADEAAKRGEPPAFCPGYVSLAERQSESARLFTKGGWRDHTDGNRIVTTRGDKVEVVRGNYRMVVLGRHRDPCDAEDHSVLPGFDASGGHIHEQSVVVAQRTDVEWKRRQNGTWHTRETTTKSDTQTIITGDSESFAYGHYRRSTVGSETPDVWHEPEDCSKNGCRTNPKIVSRVFASSMDSQTGSSAWWIPKFSDVTWGKEISSSTHVDTLSDHSEIESMTSTTRVTGEMTTATHAGTMSTVTTANVITDKITNMMMLSLTLGDSFTTTWGTQTSVTMGTMTDVVLGTEMNLTAILSVDINLGVGLDLFAGIKGDISIGGTVSINIGMSNTTNTAVQVDLALISYKKVVPLLAVKGAMVMCG